MSKVNARKKGKQFQDEAKSCSDVMRRFAINLQTLRLTVAKPKYDGIECKKREKIKRWDCFGEGFSEKGNSQLYNP